MLPNTWYIIITMWLTTWNNKYEANKRMSMTASVCRSALSTPYRVRNASAVQAPQVFSMAWMILAISFSESFHIPGVQTLWIFHPRDSRYFCLW